MSYCPNCSRYSREKQVQCSLKSGVILYGYILLRNGCMEMSKNDVHKKGAKKAEKEDEKKKNLLDK